MMQDSYITIAFRKAIHLYLFSVVSKKLIFFGLNIDQNKKGGNDLAIPPMLSTELIPLCFIAATIIWLLAEIR